MSLDVETRDKVDPKVSSPSTPTAPPAPPGRRLIAVTLHFTPDELAEYERAIKTQRAQMGGRVPQTQAVLQLIRNGGTGTGARRHPNSLVLVHVNTRGEAWYESDRGRVPASEDAVRAAMEGGKVGVAEDPTAPLTDGTRQTDPGQPQKRLPYTVAEVEAVYLRAGGRCQGCGRSDGPFHLDHIRPWSEVRCHRIDNLRLLCGGCHATRHTPDFEHRPEWRAARDAARRRRKEPSAATIQSG